MNKEEVLQESISLLKKLIQIPSISKEEKEKADFLSDFFQAKGFQVNRHYNNIWIESKKINPTKPTILLNSHIDTVKPNASWTAAPFSAKEENGKIIGLGANDAHASVVSLTAAFFLLTQQEQPYNLILAISAEEEISGKSGMESLINILPPINFAIVGEPTQMNPAIAEKGLMVLDCKAIGKAGHAAREEGDSAIYKALQDIEWIKNYTFPKESSLLGKVKMSVTMIDAGTQHNVVPDACTYVVDVRTNEFYSNQEVFEIVKKHISSEVAARSFRLNSSSVSADHLFVQRAVSLGKTPFGSATLSDQTFITCPSVKIGPGDSARSHTADEYILITEIEDAIKLYCELLDGLIF